MLAILSADTWEKPERSFTLTHVPRINWKDRDDGCFPWLLNRQTMPRGALRLNEPKRDSRSTQDQDISDDELMELVGGAYKEIAIVVLMLVFGASIAAYFLFF